jgi:hypothetical protein
VDPFRNYWTKAFRMEWWHQQLAFLRDASHELAVDAVYVWLVGSWDVAIYHASSKGAGTSGRQHWQRTRSIVQARVRIRSSKRAQIAT